MNKVGWDVPKTTQCPNTGGFRGTVIANGFPYGLTMESTPPTYVCIDTGFASTDWQSIPINAIGIFPVSDPTKIVLKNGKPDKYAIVGLTGLKILFVGKGNNPATIAACGPLPGWVSGPSNAVCINTQWMGPQEIPGPICTTCPILGVYAIKLAG